ncbi:MAG: SdrD B-like domain-containing protein [Candidatus Bathyarchaeia archaeon]
MEMNYKSRFLIATIIMASMVLAFAPALLGLGVSFASSTTPIVWTDKEDYKPGETVLIYGSGFQPKKTLIVQILRPQGTDWLVVKTDASGSFTVSYELSPERAMAGTYTVLIIDPKTDKVLATMSFTDSQLETLWGWDKKDQKWQPGQLTGWREDDYANHRLEIDNFPSGTLTFHINLDYTRGAVTGLDKAVRFYLGDGEGNADDPQYATTVYIGPIVDRNAPLDIGGSATMTTTFGTLTVKRLENGPGKAGDSALRYEITVSTWLTHWFVYWESHLAIGSSAWGGSSLHVYIDEWGSKDVPIAVPPGGKISGYKWNDLNGNGVWDAGEPAIQGWEIKLSGPVSKTTWTDSSGYYEFGDLDMGTYTVSETLQAGWTQTYPAAPGTHTVKLSKGKEEATNINFGNFQNVDIKVIKVVDADGNLDTTDDQNPKPGWTVRLYKDNVQVGGDQTTGSDGSYTWTDLGPGSYKVAEVVPAGWTSLDSSTDHDFGPVQSGQSYTWTFHNFKLGVKGGYKWNDLNGNGVWDAGEPALPDWTIQLWSPGSDNIFGTADDVLVGTDVTDSNGYYEFTGLAAGTYRVTEVLKAGWTQTYPATGYHEFTVTSGFIEKENDFGNKEMIKFLKEFTSSGALNGFTKPAISPDHVESYAYGTKTGPAIWWNVTYTVKNEDSEGHYYILWDKWGGNLLILNSKPTFFELFTNLLTLSSGDSFKIDYAGYSTYLGSGLSLTPSQGTAVATLHLGDQQEGTNPGKGKGTSKDGKAYDVDIRWEIGWLDPGETATLTIVVAPGKNPGGQLQFSSCGTYVINTGPRVRAYLDLDGDGDPYENNEFVYSWDFTNQLTVYVQTEPKPGWA